MRTPPPEGGGKQLRPERIARHMGSSLRVSPPVSDLIRNVELMSTPTESPSTPATDDDPSIDTAVADTSELSEAERGLLVDNLRYVLDGRWRATRDEVRRRANRADLREAFLAAAALVEGADADDEPEGEFAEMAAFDRPD